jgi:hypothetical protein
MGGNVGIGTTAPGEKLEVNGTIKQTGASYNLTIDSGAVITGSGYLDLRSSASYIIMRPSGSFFLNQNSTTVMTSIDTNAVANTLYLTTGKVGIGTSVPGNKLSVSGGVGIGTTAVGSLYLSTAAPDGGMIVEGNIGVGTTAPDQKLDVIGTIQASNLLGGALNITTDANGNIIRDPSDVRLKENVQPIAGALDKVMRLRGVTYNWRDKEKMGSQRDYGLIAQEVFAVTPELTATSADGIMGVKYTNMVGLLVGAMQEQQGVISDQGSRISDQQSRIENWELRIENQTNDVSELQAAVNEKLSIVSGELSSINSRLADGSAAFADIKTRLAQAEAKLAESENNLATFETATNDTLAAMLETENMLTERVLNHEDRIKALEDRIAALSVTGGGTLPANVVTQDEKGNVTLAGVFKSEKVEARGVVAGSFAVKNDENAPTTGEGEIVAVKTDADGDGWDDETKVDGKSARVKTDAVSETAKIFVTFSGDPGSRYWVEKIRDADGKLTNQFSVNVSEAVKKDVKFSWWIIEQK